ncbi:uncharacterized protein N7458_004062 [Penicillium daleae]|uniref:Uncharacterized protein n=1 Tax=Penicillium daleae TaxID=63821 RepID=A0AAD6G5H3_9EURO|nr:uncharacterized protein N7458_004062 [Penicillium daleae]KAJ5455798.1 hypothetical protein N7458_004062 [Penicillium daleae]
MVQTCLPWPVSFIFFILLPFLLSLSRVYPPEPTRGPFLYILRSSALLSFFCLSYSPNLDRGDALYETDLTEPDDALSSRKRLRSDKNYSSFELELPSNLRELYNNPLDNNRVDLSKIPKDFNKVLGTIKRRERIKGRTTFVLPKIVYGPSLVIYPYILLFSILFYTRVFRNSRLTLKA